MQLKIHSSHGLIILSPNRSSISSTVRGFCQSVAVFCVPMFSSSKNDTVDSSILHWFCRLGIAFFMKSRQSYDEKISWYQKLFAGSGIKTILVFGIRFKNLGKNMGSVIKKIYLVTTLIYKSFIFDRFLEIVSLGACDLNWFDSELFQCSSSIPVQFHLHHSVHRWP